MKVPFLRRLVGFFAIDLSPISDNRITKAAVRYRSNYLSDFCPRRPLATGCKSTIHSADDEAASAGVDSYVRPVGS